MSGKIGNRIIYFNEIDSTNSYLKSNQELLQHHGLVVLTDMQTSGRGRVSRKFVSLPGKNLTFSVVLHPQKHKSVLKNETIFNQLLLELERCLEEFSEIKKISGNKTNFDGRSALLKEWLDRSRAKGRKVCSLYNTKVQRNPKGTFGIIEGLTSEGYLQIRTESGNILTHVSGDIIDLSD